MPGQVTDENIKDDISTASRGDMPRRFREHAGPKAAADTIQQMNQQSGSSGHGGAGAVNLLQHSQAVQKAYDKNHPYKGMPRSKIAEE